jgi:hypothetical protein
MPRQFQFPAPETLLWLPITTNRYWLDRPQRDNIHSRGYYMRWNVVELGRILSKCLENDRELRYQHASEIRTDLQRLKRDTD